MMLSLRTGVLCLLLSVLTEAGFSQPIDHYRHLTDPLSITHLDDNTAPIRVATGGGWPKNGRYEKDGFFLLAGSDSAGVITRLWFELKGFTDPDAYLNIWIDDSLVITSRLNDFFLKPKGVLRPPFDTVSSGSFISDVHIPYKKNFRITYFADWQYCCLVWGIEYRPILAPESVESFLNPPSERYEKQMEAAEAKYRLKASPWDTAGSKHIPIVRSVLHGDSAVIADLPGPGVIESLRLITSHIDTGELRKTYIVMNWDGSPYPSVEVPLPDFFGCGSGLRNVSSFYQYATKGGEFTSYFPMPFEHHARLSIVNRSSVDLIVLGSLSYRPQPIDRKSTGYFSALFSSSMPATFSLYHKAAEVYGRGRFVGLHIAYPGAISPNMLEGNTIFEIDGQNENSIIYNGIEEYCGAGWIFESGPFSTPFIGCPEKWFSIYRFHVLSPYDFHKKFSLKLDHGVARDYLADIRTVSFFYRMWTPFWVSHDTVRIGDSLSIGGSGYNAKQPITIHVHDIVVATTEADAEGRFSITAPIYGLADGNYTIRVNDLIRPEPIYITSKPLVTIVRDSMPYIFRYGDRLRLHGAGFSKQKTVALYIDTVMVASAVAVDSTNSFDAVVSVPWLKEGEYQVKAISGSTVVYSGSVLSVVRILQIEGEELYPPIYSDDHAWKQYTGYHTDTTVSRRNVGFFWPQSSGKVIRFEFSVPVNDTFSIRLGYAKGRQCGIYDVLVDSAFMTRIDAYRSTSSDLDILSSVSDNTHISYLSKGRHTLEFRSDDKHPSATDRQLFFDYLLLTPVTAFDPNAPGSTLTAGRFQDANKNPISVYPNPVRNDLLYVDIAPEFGDEHFSTVTICDASGKTILVNEAKEIVGRGLDVSGLTNGTYFCVVSIEKNGKITAYISKFVVLR